MNDNPPRFGWNLRTLNVILFFGGLLTFGVLRSGLVLRVLSWPWQFWAALVAGGAAVPLLFVGLWLLVKCVRRRRWKTLGALTAAAFASLLTLVLARNTFLPWTSIEGRVVDAKTGEPLA